MAIEMLQRKTMQLAIALGAYISLPITGQADGWIKPGEEKVKLGAGLFFPAFGTQLRVNNKNVGGSTAADLEDKLGLDDRKTTFWSSAQWRFAPKHRIGLSYFRFNRDASITAQEEIEIGDQEIIATGATAETEFNLQATPINYTYSFIKNGKHELGGTVGIHWYKLDFKVDASAWVADQRGRGQVSAKTNAPLPLIGLRYDYHISPQWSVNAMGEIFALDLSDDTFAFSGSLYNVRLGTEYWIRNNLGVGAAVNAFGVDVDVEDSDWKGALNYRYWGPQIYLTIR
ncbi:MAG: hypothetical protein KZQ88_00280, partial [Candidatus Thiodiazotropha sp. (ex Dulcina madagascariensis)]|nr:hypothetical protein [Candidatus Thiodiazotropha sp. (ex Dulcina madagascariensis)]